MALRNFHEWSGVRVATGHAPWRRCTCGVAAESDLDADLHTSAVTDGTWGAGGTDAALVAAVQYDRRPDAIGKPPAYTTEDL